MMKKIVLLATFALSLVLGHGQTTPPKAVKHVYTDAEMLAYMEKHPMKDPVAFMKALEAIEREQGIIGNKIVSCTDAQWDIPTGTKEPLSTAAYMAMLGSPKAYEPVLVPSQCTHTITTLSMSLDVDRARNAPVQTMSIVTISRY